MIGRGLFEELRSDATVLALCGSNPSRIYPQVIPQRVALEQQMAAIVYSVLGVTRSATYCETVKVVRTSLQIDCYSTKYESKETLAAAVRAVLTDFRGMLGGLVDVRDAKLATEIDLMDIEPGLYRKSQTWDFWHVDT